MSRHCVYRWLGAALLALAPAAARSAPGPLEQLVESEQQRLEAEAELATLRALTQELKRSLDRQQPAPLVQDADGFDLIGVRRTVLRVIESAGTLRQANDDRRRAFQAAIDRLAREKQQAVEQYRASFRAGEEQQVERARIEWELQQPMDAPADWRRHVPPGMARALLLALLVSVVGVFAWRFEKRLALRRFARRQGRFGHTVWRLFQWTGIVAILAAAVILAWLAFWPDPGYRVLSTDDAHGRRMEEAQQTVQRNQQQQAERDRQLRQARGEFDALRAQSLHAWDRLLPPEKDAPPILLQKIEQETADQMRTLFQLAHACDRLAQETKNRNEQTRRDHQRLEDFARETPGRRQRQTMLHLGIVAAPLAFFGLAIGASRLRRRLALRRQGRQCPRCLQATLTLTPRADSPLGSPLIDLKCGSADCGYAFPATIGKLPRLDFAVYGPCASGKTTWLALAHEQWSASEPAPGAIIKPVCTEAAGTLDDLARQVLVDKKSPAPTAAPAIPEPLLYHVVDRDALAASHVVMNLFDFPGDIAQPHNVARNDASFRALSMRGFLYFFDPTGPIDVQFQSLVAFCQALRERAGLDVDAQLLVPIAVCVTKLDRLPETPLQKTAFPWLAELRKTERQPLSLALLRARSDLVRRILVELSQGYPLAEELDRAFGGNYLFFPQSNFGVQEEELGLPLQQRGALTSFGTFEPVWWLLHRNGLQMF